MKKLFIFLILAFYTFFAFSQNTPELYLPYDLRLAFSYVLDASSGTDAEKIKTFDKMYGHLVALKNSKRPAKTMIVHDMNEFLKVYRGEWPDSHSLKSDLSIIESFGPKERLKIVPANSKVKKNIEDFYQDQMQYLAKKFPSLNINSNMVQAQAQAKGKMDPQSILPVLFGTYPVANEADLQSYKLNFMNSLEGYVNEMMESLTQVGVAASQSEIKLKNASPLLEVLLKVGIPRYFEVMSLSSKKQIISAMMGENLNLDTWGKFSVMVANCGPQFQKLLQVIARENGLPPQMQEAFEKLESAGRPVPWVLGEKIVNAEAKNFSIVKTDPDALGIGTMAQTHASKFNINGVEVDGVVRFLKPEIAERLNEDDRVLKIIAPEIDVAIAKINPEAPSLTPVVEEVYQMVAAELSLEDTAAQQKRGREVYSKEVMVASNGKQIKLVISVPRVFDSRIKNSHIIAQERAPGKKLHTVAIENKASIPDLERIVAENVASAWAQSAFFDSGFFHSDLHPGNFLVDVKGNTVTVSILDFGMSGVISDKDKSLFLILGLAAQIQRADMLADVLWKLSLEEKNKITKEELRRRVSEQLKIGPLKAGQWVVWGLKQRLRAPSHIINLSRGMAALDMMLKSAGSSKTTYATAVQLARKNVLTTVKLLRSENIISWRDIAAAAWQVSINKLTNSSTTSTADPQDPQSAEKNKGSVARMCRAIFANGP